MTTRRIESPRYGMVVTDGIAGRVFMLVTPTTSLPAPYGGSTRFVWEAVRINGPDRKSPFAAQRARVYLAPGEFAEVR